MPDQKWPPISPGTPVRTTLQNTSDKEWTAEARQNRKWGVEGTIITHHSSHGLCYEVRHTDGTVGAYDPTELEEISK
jgi:hypothetical protein